jgi:hypothetical protein
LKHSRACPAAAAEPKPPPSWLTARAPLSYTCYACGRGFGSESLLIHVPRCEALFAAREAAGTGGAAAAGTSAPRRLPPRPAALAAPLPRAPAEVEAFNAEMAAIHEARVMVTCRHCRRTFV